MDNPSVTLGFVNSVHPFEIDGHATLSPKHFCAIGDRHLGTFVCHWGQALSARAARRCAAQVPFAQLLRKMSLQESWAARHATAKANVPRCLSPTAQKRAKVPVPNGTKTCQGACPQRHRNVPRCLSPTVRKCAKVPVPNGTKTCQGACPQWHTNVPRCLSPMAHKRAKVPVAGGTLLDLDVSHQQRGRPKAAPRKQRCSYA